MKKKNFWIKMLVIAAVIVVLLLLLAFYATAADRVVYTVKKGDTLGELMFTWKVQSVEVEKLFTWNPGLGTQVKIGQEIVYYLPDRSEAKMKLSEQEIKKVVEATMSQIQAKAPASIPKNSKKGQALQLIWISVLIAVVVIIVTVLIAFSLRRSKRKTSNETAKKTTVVTIALGDNGLYVTDLEFDPATGRWLTPFRHLSGGDRMWGKAEGEARRSARKCWQNTAEYGDQIQKLISKGIIREKTKKQAAV